MTAQPDAIQQQLIDARRAQILEAATQVFAEKGFHRATIKEIAQTAGVADGTIYNYFNNKTALLIGLLERLNESDTRTEDFSMGMSEGDFKRFLTLYLRHRIELVWANVEVFRAVLPEILVNPALRTQYREQVIEPTLQMAEGFLQRSMNEGELRPLDVPLTVRALAGSLLGLLILQMLGDAELAARQDELPELLATLLFDGLNPAGREE